MAIKWPCTSTAWKMYITKCTLNSPFAITFRFVFKFQRSGVNEASQWQGVMARYPSLVVAARGGGAIKLEATMWLRKVLEGKMWIQRFFRSYTSSQLKQWLLQSVLMRIFPPPPPICRLQISSFFHTSFNPFGFQWPVQRLKLVLLLRS